MRIYSYGARPPVENADALELQFALANSYHHTLVLIEHDRRHAVDRIFYNACPAEHDAYTAASKVASEAAQAVRLCRDTGGEMLAPDDDEKAERRETMKSAKAALEDARHQEIVARQALKDAKKAALPLIKEKLQACDVEARERNKFTYNAAGDITAGALAANASRRLLSENVEILPLAWGTRLKIGEFAERGAKMAAKEGSLPHLPRMDGGGMCAVQLQGGLPVAEAVAGADTQFRIQVVDAAAWQAAQGSSAKSVTKRDGRVIDLPQRDPNSKRSQRRDGIGYALVSLRIGSHGRTPVWATWPIILHRPLPQGAQIKWASAHAKKVGQRTEWQICVTVDGETYEKPEAPRASVLAVNLGWRNLKDGGVRVAYAVGSDGYTEEVRVPPSLARGVNYVESVRSTRDTIFNQAQKILVDWREDGERPAWFMERTAYAHAWRSPGRLVSLVRLWRERRFDGDETVFKVMDAWAGIEPQAVPVDDDHPHGERSVGNKHLRFIECDVRQKGLRMRLDHYRAVAARWAARYERIVVTDMDLRDFAGLPEPEEGAASKDRVQRSTRMLAAPSEMRGAIKNACSTRGTGFEEIKAVNKTRTCNACGGVMAFSARTDVMHTCPFCKVEWDQDENHCKNLLVGAKVDVVNVERSGPKKSRWSGRRKQEVVQA